MVDQLLSRISLLTSLADERYIEEKREQQESLASRLSTPAEDARKRVRVLLCDSSGLRRCRVVPWHRFRSIGTTGLGLTSACMAQPAYSDCIAPNSGLDPVGEIRLVPASPVVDLPWAPGHCMVLADMCTQPSPLIGLQQGALSPPTLPSWSGCPRAALRRALVALKEEYGLSLMCGFETEFVLLRREQWVPGRHLEGGLPPLHPVDDAPYAHSRATGACAAVLDDMVDTLENMGIPCLQYHAESGPGQFEIVTSHFEALEAADKLLFTREAIVGVAAKHGLEASFVPKMSSSAAGCGCHCHLSLWKGGVNIMAAAPSLQDPAQPHPSLSEQASCFLAGVLQGLPTLLLFTAPSFNSFDRLVPGGWSGAFTAWGWDNREVPLRLTCPPTTNTPDSSPAATPFSSLNAEYKAMDATANPYIALTAIVAAGMLGSLVKCTLPPPLQVPPALLDPSEQAERGISRLPASLSDAISQLETGRNAWMCDELQAMYATLLGPCLMRAYLAVRRAEAAKGPIDMPRMHLLY
eukprot:CAMPEP_0202402976 /NCGR_PEP_ID=MMETSP1128-20130828/4623_1 /ASSEMBLY_ACC=CAM_ASM_000463 /TAXON_ID=3047 /ORGANISM="Dunaliella tertiolecta, Strain CCMP1320" /LENGTH=523 /DNA_ID=CAMNT_0049007133 /DNA_START=152 /DNA_END=1723 /DNA_ORIENTATION=-